MQVIDRETGLQCAELQERLRPNELAKVAVELAQGISRCADCGGAEQPWGCGAGVHASRTERYETIYRQRGEPGWLTTAVSKPEMTGLLGSLLEQRPEMFHSKRLLGECRTFVGEGARADGSGERSA